MTNSLMSDIPEDEKKHFERFYIMYSKLLALQNLSKSKISFHKARFKRVLNLMEKGLFDDARTEMSDCIMQLQLKTPIKGFGIQVDHIK